PAPPSAAGWGWRRPLVLAAALAAAAGLWLAFRDELALEAVAAREQELREYALHYPAAVVASAFALYVAVTALSVPVATLLTFTLSWFFAQAFGETAGFWTALVVISFASASGSTLAFLLSRYLFRGLVERRFGERLRKFDAALKREGAFYLFTLRVWPLVPFFVINLVMGLTPMRARTFWWVSQLGMLPGTAIYTWVGSSLPALSELAEQGVGRLLSWQLVVALVLLGLFPLAAKKGLQFVARHRGRDSKRVA
ncbi:MAG TPA: TVP38/TMEM64 family protein, partial [Planctomycetaceae bacterium]|nr:TVP38/TMEM64 family protein [Planctomycetaceae bacterium]